MGPEVSEFETGFVAYFAGTETREDIQPQLVTCSFFADDAIIDVTIDVEEHPEMSKLSSRNKGYRITIESIDE